MSLNLIIWDHTSRQPFAGIQADWVCSSEAFEQIEDFSVYQKIFVKARLPWSVEPAPTVYEGLNVLLLLRLQRVQCPICFCSTEPRVSLLENGILYFGFLRIPHAHPYILLPSLVVEAPVLQTARSLSPLQLEDAIQHFTDARGVVREQFHYLKNHLTTPIQTLNRVAKLVSGVLPINQISEWEVILERLRAQLSSQEHEHIAQYLKQARDAVLDLLPVKGRNERTKPLQLAPWRVLYVDDQQKHLDELRAELAARQIHCTVARSGKDAISLLRKDWEGVSHATTNSSWPQNAITVVVSDLRFENEDGDWLPMQGYDLLKYVNEQLENTVSFVILSAKKTGIDSLREHLPHLRHRSFLKDDIFLASHGRGFSLLADHIRQEGSEVFDLLCSFPSASIWNKPWKNRINVPYRKLYRAFRMHVQYREKEYWIGKCAQGFIEEAELVKDNKLFPQKKKVEGLGFKPQFKASILEPTVDDSSLEKFYVKLIGRRIAIGLHFRGWSIDDISNILRFRKLGYDAADRQLFSAYLALSTRLENSIAGELLIEERTWLRYTLGISPNVVDRRFFDAFTTVMDEFQNRLINAGCSDDFVESNLVVGDKDSAHDLFKRMQYFCQDFHLEDALLEKMTLLFGEDRYQKAVERNSMNSLLD